MRKFRIFTVYQTLLGRLNKYDDRDMYCARRVSKCTNNLAGKSEENRPLGRPRCRWGDNNKINITGTG
jgi:hypothetical protein